MKALSFLKKLPAPYLITSWVRHRTRQRASAILVLSKCYICICICDHYNRSKLTLETFCIGRGVLLWGPGPIVAGGLPWLKLLEDLEGGFPRAGGISGLGLGGGGGFIDGCTGKLGRGLDPCPVDPCLVGLELLGTGGLLVLGGGGGGPPGFTDMVLCACVVGLGLGDTLGEEF